MPQGKNVSTYRFKVHNKKTGENLYFSGSNDIFKKLKIPKTSVFNLLKKGLSPKWKDYEIDSCLLPIYKIYKVPIEYN